MEARVLALRYGSRILLGASLLAAFPGIAHAQDKQACADANQRAKDLHAAKKLIEAQAQFVTCARTCAAVGGKAYDGAGKECESALGALESSIPTVVFAATGQDGEDLPNVTVAVDGQSPTRIDGKAVSLDPGDHVFVFTASDGTKKEMNARINEGEKARRLVASFKRDEPPKPDATTQVAPTPVAPPPAQQTPSSPTNAEPATDTSSGSSLRTIGYVVGGVGVVGLVVGTIFGLKAISSKDSANCNANNECLPEHLADARSSATVSTVGIAAGAALALGGLALVLFAPSAGSPSAGSSARLEVRTSTGGAQSGLVLRGVW